jgi:hypothetical protein
VCVTERCRCNKNKEQAQAATHTHMLSSPCHHATTPLKIPSTHPTHPHTHAIITIIIITLHHQPPPKHQSPAITSHHQSSPELLLQRPEALRQLLTHSTQPRTHRVLAIRCVMCFGGGGACVWVMGGRSVQQDRRQRKCCQSGGHVCVCVCVCACVVPKRSNKTPTARAAAAFDTPHMTHMGPQTFGWSACTAHHSSAA